MELKDILMVVCIIFMISITLLTICSVIMTAILIIQDIRDGIMLPKKGKHNGKIG